MDTSQISNNISALTIAIVGALLSFALGFFARIIYDGITRRKQKRWAVRAFLSRLALLKSSVSIFDILYSERWKLLEANWRTFPIEYVIDNIEPQSDYGFDSPNPADLSLLCSLSQYLITALSAEIQTRNMLLVEANKLIKSLSKVNDDQRSIIINRLKRVVSDLRSEQLGIGTLAVSAQESINNYDLTKYDTFYYSAWENLGESYRLGLQEFCQFNYFKQASSGLYIPLSLNEMRWKYFIFKFGKYLRFFKFWGSQYLD
jgi:hypothetical protein